MLLAQRVYAVRFPTPAANFARPSARAHLTVGRNARNVAILENDFACAIATQDANDLSGFDAQRDALQDVAAAVKSRMSLTVSIAL